MKSIFFKSFSVVILALTLTSCVETVVVGSVATGAVATREKSLSDTKKDVVISTKLGAEFFENGLKNPFNSVDVTVNEGRVLLTGIADAKGAKLANDLAWKVEGVREVIDEIQIADDKKGYFKRTAVASGDYFTTALIESKLFISTKIRSFNFQITTVNKTVYVLGVASNRTELNRVLEIISKTSGVEKVVNHAIIVDDRRRNGGIGVTKKGTYKEEDEEAIEVK